jgi:FkbM family methyltransferase
MSLIADYADLSIVPSLRITKKYEAVFSDVLDDLIEPGQTLIDVGAHIGYHAIRFAQATGPAGKVVAYEPERSLNTLLEANIVRNGVDAWTTAEALAVSALSSAGKLWRNGDNTGGASLSAECVDAVSSAAEVSVVSLDDEAADDRYDSRRIDVVKIDVQGYEAKVVEGAVNLIERDQPFLAFEYNPSQLDAAGSDPEAFLGSLVDSDYGLYVADEFLHVFGRGGPEDIHRWCITEKPNGPSGFVNVIAGHRSRNPWL